MSPEIRILHSHQQLYWSHPPKQIYKVFLQWGIDAWFNKYYPPEKFNFFFHQENETRKQKGPNKNNKSSEEFRNREHALLSVILLCRTEKCTLRGVQIKLQQVVAKTWKRRKQNDWNKGRNNQEIHQKK